MRFLFFALISLSIIACGDTASRSTGPGIGAIKDNPDLPKDFMQFYMQFHTDSSYQMEHIIFPLSGLPANVDSTILSKKAFTWDKESWQMHRPFNVSDGYQQEYVSVDNETVVEYIIQKYSRYGIERRFSRLSGEWYMIYYAAMNQLE